MVVVVLMASSPSPSSSIQFSNSFPCKQLLHPKPNLSFFSTTTTRATDPESNTTTDPTTSPSSPPAPETSTDSFENRLTRIKYRSGIGKKAEQRKGKKSKKLSSTGGGGGGSDLFLPPVPLKEPVSGGLKVNLGFDPYAERLNGRLAILGMVALLLVELGSGKSVIKYHTPSVVFLQVYFIASVTALYVKLEKEKVSTWPISAKK